MTKSEAHAYFFRVKNKDVAALRGSRHLYHVSHCSKVPARLQHLVHNLSVTANGGIYHMHSGTSLMLMVPTVSPRVKQTGTFGVKADAALGVVQIKLPGTWHPFAKIVSLHDKNKHFFFYFSFQCMSCLLKAINTTSSCCCCCFFSCLGASADVAAMDQASC